MTTRAQRLLALGIVCLEFATATTAFVTSTLLPVLVPELHAETQIGWLLAAPTLGLFVAMPMAAAFSARASTAVVTGGGVVLTVAAACVSVTATQGPAFAVGRFVAGFSGALLAVNGITAAIRHLDESLRRRVLTLSALMWVIAGSLGPSLVLGAYHLWGWRVTVALPALVVISAQAVIATAGPTSAGESAQPAPSVPLRSFALPAGIALLLAGPSGILGILGLVVSAWGFIALMPRGALAARRGAPAALLSMTLFATSYFGVDSVYPLFITGALSGSLIVAGVSLGVAAVAWALGQMAVEKFGPLVRLRHKPGSALAVFALFVAAMSLAATTSASPLVTAGVWILAGFAVGVYYPTVYLRATTDTATSASVLAAAVMSAEAYGSLLGSSLAGTLTAGRTQSVTWFALLHAIMSAVALGGAVLAARSTPPASRV